jgi:Ca2+-binding EF-hand superfamily protein
MGRGGFGGPTGLFANAWFEQADQNHDQKLTQTEFANLSATWFSKMDAKGAGKLSQNEFAAGLDEVLPLNFGGPGGGRGRGPGGQRGGNEGMSFGVGRMLGSGLFTSADANKDGSLSSAELSGLFDRWFANWDTNKTGSVSSDQFRDGLAASLPRFEFGQRGPGGFAGPGGGGGFGGAGGAGGFGMFGRQALAQQMVRQGDKDKDGQLSKPEFVALAAAWFDKLDNSDKVTQEQFTAKFADALGMSEPAAGGQAAGAAANGGERPARGESGETRGANEERGGRRRGPGGGAMGGPASLAPGVFAAVDKDKDGSLTRAELKSAFEDWFDASDSEKSGKITSENLYAQLREKLPQGGFGGQPGGGFAGGGFNGGGFGGERGAPPKALTAEQVSLVRAWIDQGAK